MGDLAAYNNLTQWVGEDPNIPELCVSATNFLRRLFALVSYSSYKQERTKIAALLLTRQKGFHIKRLNFAEKDKNNNTVLSLACKNGLDLIVSLILMVGSQLCCRSSLLTVGLPTPLWHAANTGHAETLAVLIPYIHESDLGQHVAPDGTSPLIRAVMRNKVAAMKQIMKKYNTMDVLIAVARYGSADLFDALNLKRALSKEILIEAVETENFEMVKKLVEVTRTEKDPELAKRVEDINKVMLKIEEEVKKPIFSEAIRELFALTGWPKKLRKNSFLVDELSKKFPKFNPEVEDRIFPLIYRNEISIKEVKEKALLPFCPLREGEKSEVTREVAKIPLSECFQGCKQ